MDVTELHSVQAARWVWGSLWSTRHHAKVDILDVALFDGSGDGVEPGTGTDTGLTVARWLFTAKDGRIMKKAAHNASIGALKQSLLGRVHHGALENGDNSSSGDSRPSRKTAARGVFAAALLSSGKFVELDEGAWETLIVGGRGGQDSVSAVTALVPWHSVDHRRGSRQRVTCEFRLKTQGTKGCVDDTYSAPTQVSMTTYVLVSSGLLREEGEQVDEGQDKNDRGGGRLVSRAKTTNHEVEAKLRRIVQWVQDTRGVKVLRMTAMFIVLSPLGSGTPGVWLDRVMSVRMIPKEVGAVEVAAPFADAPTVTLVQRTKQAPERQEPSTKVGPQDSPQSTLAAEYLCPPSEAVLTRKQIEESGITKPRAAGGVSFGEASEIRASVEHGSSAFARTALPADVRESTTKNQSIMAILSSGTDAVLSVGEREMPRDGGGDTARSTDDGRSGISLSSITTSVGRRGHSVAGPQFSQTAPRDRCAGDFCSYHETSRDLLTASTKGTEEGGNPGAETALNWTDVVMSDKEGGALLDVAGKHAAMCSLNFKSVVLARVEAKAGHDVYWGEGLRKCYREGGCRAGRLEELNSMQIYKEVSVCRRCHGVYQRLDRLREEVGRTGGRTAGLTGNGILARVDAAAVHGRRTAAAEAGAAILSAEVTAMLKDVDARTGKLGIEAGIIWRRRLSKNKSSCRADITTAHSQAFLTDRLARPKPRTSDDVGPPGSKRQVKSQGDMAEHTGNRHHRRHTGMGEPLRSLPLLPRRKGWACSSRQGFKQGDEPHEDEEETSALRFLPPVIPRRSSWTLHEKHATNADTADSTHGSSEESIHRRCGIEERPLGVDSGGACGTDPTNLTVNAIEAMLEEGGEAYLPGRVGDLPEASVVLGNRATSPCRTEERGIGGLVSSGGKRPRWSDRGEKCKSRGTKSERDQRRVHSSSDSWSTENVFGVGDDQENEGRLNSVRRRATRSAERFLHPWQRKLENRKREAGRTDGDEFAMQKERQRRSESRRAAVRSTECRRAGRRVAARLGRQRHRLRRKGGQGGRDERLLISSNERGKSTSQDKFSAFDGGASGLKWVSGSFGGREGCLDQMRDTLGWARKTFGALMRRLRERGVALGTTDGVPNGQNGGNLVPVVHGIQSQLRAFDDTRASFGAETTGSMGAANMTSLQSRCDAACDSFESNFCRLIDELTAAEGKQNGICEPPSLGEKNRSATLYKVDQFQSDSHEGSASGSSYSNTARTTSDSTFGFCPSCSVLPVARRCLDCEGGGAERDRCSGCFVRDHRDADRRNHRFLRVSGVGDTAPPLSSTEHAPEGKSRTTTEEVVSGIASLDDPVFGSSNSSRRENSSFTARCSICGDLAAARRCRDCRVDTCAACHFLAHRTPSRQAHVTEFVGETAVALQEALHQRRQLGRRRQGGSYADEGSTTDARRLVSGNGEDDVNDGNDIEGSKGPVFGEEAAQSLAQVRSTGDAPVVRPLPSDTSRLRTTSPGDPAIAHDAVEEGQSEGRSTGSGDNFSSAKSKSEKDNNEDCHKGGGGQEEEAQEANGSKELDEEEDAGGASSTDEDTDDEGMMWCPLNIAKVDLSASTAGEASDKSAPSPPTTPVQPVENDETEHKQPHSPPSTPGGGGATAHTQ